MISKDYIVEVLESDIDYLSSIGDTESVEEYKKCLKRAKESSLSSEDKVWLFDIMYSN